MRLPLAFLLLLLASMIASAAPTPSLRGSLGAPALWQAYKAKFISPGGRVIDNANADISHSEGQGYGLLLAVAADDPAAFATIWQWTRAQLMLRDDGLAAWRWDPAATPHVSDRNNASDGDLLIGWALAEAGEAWHETAYKTAALQMIQAVAENDIADTAFGPVLKPGSKGFAKADRPDGPVVNLSYWVFPALARFASIAPDRPFDALTKAGLRLIGATRLGPSRLPSDWVSLAAPSPTLANGFPPTFGYDAIRMPLYIVWAGLGDAKTLAPFAPMMAEPAIPPMRIDVQTGKVVEPLVDSGYRAIAALTRCALHGTAIPAEFRSPEVDRYYPSTLRALVLIAAHQSASRCL